METGKEIEAEVEADTAERLRSVVGRLSRRLRSTRAAAGLTPSAVSVLFTVFRRGPLRLSRLAEIEELNPTMLSRVVAELAEHGLVRRLADPDDGRAALVEATAAGRRMRARILAERAEVLGAELESLTEEDRGTVERALPILEELTDRLKGRLG